MPENVSNSTHRRYLQKILLLPKAPPQSFRNRTEQTNSFLSHLICLVIGDGSSISLLRKVLQERWGHTTHSFHRNKEFCSCVCYKEGGMTDRDTRMHSYFHASHRSTHPKAYSCLLPSLPPRLRAVQFCQAIAAFHSQPQAALFCRFSFPVCQWRSVFEQGICFADNA